MAGSPPRVLLADDDVLARNLLRAVCSDHGMHVVAETAAAAELVDLCRQEAPDVALTAVDLEGGSVDECLGDLLATGARVVVLARDPSPERLIGLLARGVSGYLFHDSSPVAVAEAVLAVANGAAALHPTAAVTILQQWRELRRGGAVSVGGRMRASLTAREYDVLEAMADGLATKAIARRLGVAVKTVENHKIRVFDKLGVRTQAHAVSLAIGQGLLTRGRT